MNNYHKMYMNSPDMTKMRTNRKRQRAAAPPPDRLDRLTLRPGVGSWPATLSTILLLLPWLDTARSGTMPPGNNCDEYDQPGVGPIRLCLHGDDACHYFTYTSHGDDGVTRDYAVVHEDEVVGGTHTGRYTYATLGFEGLLVSTGLEVGLDDPAAHFLAPGILPSCAVDDDDDDNNDEQDNQFVHRDIPRASLPAPARHDRNARGGLRKLQSLVSANNNQNKKQKQQQKRKRNRRRRKAESHQTGRRRYLVAPVRFADHVRIDRQLPSTRELNDLYNRHLREIYLANSEGRFDLQSVIAPAIDLPGEEYYYADPNGGKVSWEAMRELIHLVLDRLDDDPDFQFHDPSRDGPNPGDYIGLNIVMSGYGGEFGRVDCETQATAMERTWSHQWATQTWVGQNEGISFRKYVLTSAFWGTCNSEMMRLGPVFHETSHLLGLSDLYHLSSSGYQGVGAYDIMGDSFGFNRRGEGGMLSAYSRVKLGWCQAKNIRANGIYTLQPSSSTNSRCRVYRINTGFPSKKEYLLIEARNPMEYDINLPEQGLAIWHIDKNIPYMSPDPSPNSASWPREHGRVVLLQADGQHHLQTGVYQSNDNDSLGDLFHSGASLEPGNGHPNSDSWSDGIVRDTGIFITNIRRLDNGGMEFEFWSDLL